MGESREISDQLFSKEPETLGFDISAGTKWIYPENYPKREYQFSITRTALFSNTLVCLPTGLGKTFIAAVVMYNFWRWYPKGKIVFLAPTKPLVAQQITACHDIMGIPSSETVELTGAINASKRQLAWIQNRVIFATPQTFQKDLQNNIVPCESIKCIVFDEAHKALGKHAYCEIIRILNEKNKYFRVLALSATPGSKIDHVREVIENLLISELELRDDNSEDIIPYVNDRSIKKIVIRLTSILAEFRERYINVMSPHVKILYQNNILKCDASSITKGRIFMTMNQMKGRPDKGRNYSIIMKTLTVLMTMYHAFELLTNYGLRAFYNFYMNHNDKFWMDKENDLKQLLEDIKSYIGDFPVISAMSDNIPDIPDNLIFGHEKFNMLKEILLNHFNTFKNNTRSTRAIIFVEYRDIVNDVFVLLLQSRPLIRPQMFVGQAGLKQKQQIKALEDFRNNEVNVLISTSVGEEGLDVGEVDLIVCFDISTSTPTRLVQRIGRTGRKRDGSVIVLVTEGNELKTFDQAMFKKSSINSRVLQSSNIISSMNQESPRMVPNDLNPECYSMHMKILPKTPKEQKAKKKAPVERKRKKKEINTVVGNVVNCELENSRDEAVTTQTTAKSTNQPSWLDKYLRPKNILNNELISNDISEIDSSSSKEFQIKKKSCLTENNVIRPESVKLLTVDSNANEFLTLCAMKKSAEECNIKKRSLIKINPKFVRRKEKQDIFNNFSVPLSNALDCIKFLTENVSTTIISNRNKDEIDSIDGTQNEDMNFVAIDGDSSSKFPVMNFDENCKSPYQNKSDREIQFSKYWVGQEPMDIDQNYLTLESKYSGTNVPAENLQVSSTFKYEEKKKPAEIKRNFTDILDDNTESEATDISQSSEREIMYDPIEESFKQQKKNFFDDILYDSSDDDDTLKNISNLEEDSPHDLKSNVNLSSNIETTSMKRVAASPQENPITKRQKLIEQYESISSMDEVTIIEEISCPRNKSLKGNELINNRTINLEKNAHAAPHKNNATSAVLDADQSEQQITSQVPTNYSSDEDLFEGVENDFVTSKNVLNSTLMNISKKTAEKPCEFGNEKQEKYLYSKEIKIDFEKSTLASCLSTVNKKMIDNASKLNKKENCKKEDNCTNGQTETIVLKNVKNHEIIVVSDDDDDSEKILSNIKKSQINPTTEVEKNNTCGVDLFITQQTNESRISQKSKDKKKNNLLRLNSFKKNSESAKTMEDKTAKLDPDLINLVDNDDFEEPFSIYKSQATSLTSTNLISAKRLQLHTKPAHVKNSSELKTEDIKKTNTITCNKEEMGNPKEYNSGTIRLPLKQVDLDFEDINFGGSFDEPNKNQISNCVKKDSGNENIKPNTKENVNFQRCHQGFLNLQKKSQIHNSKDDLQTRNNVKSTHLQVNNKSFGNSSEIQMEASTFTSFAMPKLPKNGINNNLSKKKKDLKNVHMNIRYQRGKKADKVTSKMKRKLNYFIDDEAEVSENADTTDGSSDSDDDELNSFVSNTQYHDESHMVGHYMQTVRSPIRSGGGFMFKNIKKPKPDINIFSQPVTQVEDTYLYDSFCVKEDDEEYVTAEEGCSSTENSSSDDLNCDGTIIYSSRRKRCKPKTTKNIFEKLKVRKILTSNDSSSEDETEKLRREILDQTVVDKSNPC